MSPLVPEAQALLGPAEFGKGWPRGLLSQGH